MRHLLGIAGMDRDRIVALLDDAEHFASGETRLLPGLVIVNAFYENSTRTTLSFQLAGYRLGAHVLSFVAERSSVAKGESLHDTARTLEAVGADIIVVRHSVAGAASDIAGVVRCGVVNAGDGTNEHPTQALTDALALRRRFGALDGLTVAICGDIVHSRVARSNLHLLTTMGARVRVTGPAALLPIGGLPAGAEIMGSLDEAVADADAVMMLRVQHERMAERLSIGGEAYHGGFGLTASRFARAAPHAVILHPGPMNRDVEIATELADSPRSLILEQVALGVPVRMACLSAVSGRSSRT